MILLDNDNVAFNQRSGDAAAPGSEHQTNSRMSQVFLNSIKEASPPHLTGSGTAVDDPSALRQQLASAFLHSAVTPAQRLDAAPQRAQYL